MKFSLNIESDDELFHDDPDHWTAEALRSTANVVGCSGSFRGSGSILDANGNTVGHWSLTDVEA